MADFAQVLDALIRDALVQTTAILTVGLLAARYVRLPARVHAVLLMAFVAAAVTPLASGIVRHGGWGLLAPQAQADEPSSRLEPSALAATGRASTHRTSSRLSHDKRDRG